MKVYIVEERNIDEYYKSPYVRAIFKTREASERYITLIKKSEDSKYYDYEIKEEEVYDTDEEGYLI